MSFELRVVIYIDCFFFFNPFLGFTRTFLLKSERTLLLPELGFREWLTDYLPEGHYEIKFWEILL